MITNKEYRLCVDDAAGTTVIIVKAVCGDTADSPAYMSLMQVAGYLQAAHKRPQACALHRPSADGVRCGGIDHQLSMDSEAALITEHTSKAIQRRHCRPAPPRGLCSGYSNRPGVEKR